MALTSRHVYDALRTVHDPDLHKDLVTLNMVKDVRIAPGNSSDSVEVNLVIELTTPACPMKDKIKADVERAITNIAATEGITSTTINIEFTADVRKANERLRDSNTPLPNVQHVIAVGAGKGGVGKSTIAVNLAVGLARLGAKTALLDGDIYGPSIATMLGLDDIPTAARGQTLLPFEVHGIKAMTIGKLVDPEKALIWRGPMAHGAFKQLAMQTDWGELDYLIIDLPPGTGDVPLTLAQLLPLTGAVVVCTPQKVAQDDARRAVRMFQQLGVDVLGIVENMSYFIGDDGKQYDIFGRGGAENMAQAMNLPFLGAVPIHMELRAHADQGTPLKNWDVSEAISDELDALCKNLASQISIVASAGRFVQPTLSVT
ncbi:MAG TPA: Mrp/NBP35 family ATP-binding protein [Phycisphaerales bacterium]|nr:Mrp/NBP35 family ATP-binding protein [Phycisphaerales bacterium]